MWFAMKYQGAQIKMGILLFGESYSLDDSNSTFFFNDMKKVEHGNDFFPMVSAYHWEKMVTIPQEYSL